MVLRNIKKLVFAVIAMGMFTHGGSVYAVITTKEVITNLCNKTMTSEMMEDYLRNNRLKARIKKWQEDLQAWQKRWNVTIDKNFKLNSVSEKAFHELCEIPFYIFCTAVFEDDSSMMYVQEKYFKKVYVYSDKEAENFYAKAYQCSMEDARKYFSKYPGFHFTYDSDDFIAGNYIFINDRFSHFTDSEQLDIGWILEMGEHELSHFEQFLDWLILDVLTGEIYRGLNDDIVKFAECMKNASKNQSSDGRLITARFAYEFCEFVQNWDENKGVTFSDLFDYNFCCYEEFKKLKEKKEGEADKRAIKFHECPMMAYHEYKDRGIRDNIEIDPVEYHQEEGYYSNEKRAQLFIERLVKEGRLPAQNVDSKKQPKPKQQKFIWFPHESDKKNIKVFYPYHDRELSHDGQLRSKL